MNSNKSINFAKYLKQITPSIIFNVNNNEITIYVNSSDMLKVVFFIKKHTTIKVDQLLDITAIDFPQRKNRFEVVYQYISIKYNNRICISTSVPEGSSLESVTSLYPSAGWYERETWDIFGVHFCNHPDLRRILTDYGFKGHPLRKDFPVTGFIETCYSEFNKRVIYEKVNLAQEYRLFSLSCNYN